MNTEVYQLLQQSVEQFAAWRKHHPDEAVDLAGADLGGRNLHGIDLSQCRLNGAHLEKCDLTGATLTAADLSGANLKQCKMHGAHLQGATLQNALLDGADLEGANLTGAEGVGASMKGANLKGARMVGINLEGANLQNAHLIGADLQAANLQKAHLEGAVLDHGHLEGANLERALLQKAHLEGAHLERADVQFANLDNADLRGAEMEGAFVAGATHEGADLKGAHTSDMHENYVEHKDQMIEPRLKKGKPMVTALLLLAGLSLAVFYLWPYIAPHMGTWEDPAQKAASYDKAAQILMEEKKYDEALATMYDVIKRKPDNGSYRYHLGLALYYKGQENDAIDQFEQAASLPITDFDLKLLYISVRGLAKDNPHAIQAFKLADQKVKERHINVNEKPAEK